MEFVLHYRGPLKANGKPEHKHEIRRVFYEQLGRLWAQPPLIIHRNLLEPRRQGKYSVLRDQLPPYVFAHS